jgi:predicted outer membrane repeat protein
MDSKEGFANFTKISKASGESAGYFAVQDGDEIWYALGEREERWQKHGKVGDEGNGENSAGIVVTAGGNDFTIDVLGSGWDNAAYKIQLTPEEKATAEPAPVPSIICLRADEVGSDSGRFLADREAAECTRPVKPLDSVVETFPGPTSALPNHADSRRFGHDLVAGPVPPSCACICTVLLPPSLISAWAGSTVFGHHTMVCTVLSPTLLISVWADCPAKTAVNDHQRRLVRSPGTVSPARFTNNCEPGGTITSLVCEPGSAIALPVSERTGPVQDLRRVATLVPQTSIRFSGARVQDSAGLCGAISHQRCMAFVSFVLLLAMAPIVAKSISKNFNPKNKLLLAICWLLLSSLMQTAEAQGAFTTPTQLHSSQAGSSPDECLAGSYFCPGCSAACGDSVIDLTELISPFSLSISASEIFNFSTCGEGRAAIFTAQLAAGDTITIGMISTNYDSVHEARWGESCPGQTGIACTDDPDTSQQTWNNNQGRTQSFFFIVNSYAYAENTHKDGFTLSWQLSTTTSTNIPRGSCVLCPVGQYQPAPEALSSCSKCPTGQTTVSAGTTLQAGCIACPVGKHFRESSTDAWCLDCPMAKYQPARASLVCLECPPAFTTPHNSTVSLSSCAACQRGTWFDTFPVDSRTVEVFLPLANDLKDSGVGHLGLTATCTECPVFSKGTASFDGEGQFLNIPAFSFGGSFTVAVWIKVHSVANWAHLFDWSNGKKQDNIAVARIGTTSGLDFAIRKGDDVKQVVVDGFWETNVWTHLIVTARGTTMEVYKDGVLKGSNPDAWTPVVAMRKQQYIGKSSWAEDAFFTGQIKSFIMTNSPVMASAVQHLYQGTSPGLCLECPSGKFQPAQAAHSCLQCPAGYSTPGMGTANSSGCVVCPIGQHSVTNTSGLCLACPTGQYQPESGETSCKQCPPGYSSAATFSVLSPASVHGDYACLQAAFGGAIPINLIATVHVVSPSTGCDDMPSETLTGKIALIKRGRCLFTVKARNAQKAGAVAVIVYNSVFGLVPLTAHAGDGEDIVIPVLGTDLASGQKLAAVPSADFLHLQLSNHAISGAACTACPAGKHLQGKLDLATVALQGTSHDRENLCVECMKSQYQPSAAQLSCQQCPPGGTTAGTGTVAVSGCTSCSPGSFFIGAMNDSTVAGCGTVYQLVEYTVPHTTTSLTISTVTASEVFPSSCGSGKAAIFAVRMDPGTSIVIGQTANTFDSKHETRWGGACPGDVRVACTDDPDTSSHSWVNNEGQPQNLYFIVDAFSPGTSGSFTVSWELTGGFVDAKEDLLIGSCAQCAAGQYQQLQAALSCTDCPEGRQAPSAGSTSLVDCAEVNTYPSSYTELRAGISGVFANTTFTLPGLSFNSDYDEEIDVTGKSITILGNGAVLDASRKGSFFLLRGKGHSSTALELVFLTLKNGRNTATRAFGGAITNENGFLSITNATFFGNTVARGDFGGGAISSVNGALRIVSTIFSQNNGAAFSAGGAVRAFMDASYAKIRAPHNSFIGCIFRNNQCVGAVAAGAVLTNGNTQLDSCSFVFNVAEYYGAGALLLVTTATVGIFNSFFTGNFADPKGRGQTAGGAVSIGIRGIALIVNTTIHNNSAASAGAIFADRRSDLTVINSKLRENSALVGDGGAIKSLGKLMLLEVDVARNSALKGAGGAVYSYAGTITADHAAFTGNSARTMGGAVASTSLVLDSSNISFVLCHFEFNTVTAHEAFGGAIAHHSIEQAAGTVALPSNVRVRSCTNPKPNFATSEYNLCPVGCVATATQECTSCPCSVSPDGSESKTWNRTSISQFNSTSFASNEAAGAGSSGGALSFVNVQAVLLNTTVQSNRASLMGGGIFMGEGSSELLCTATSIALNSAAQSSQLHSASGGGIQMSSASSIVLGSPGLGVSVTKAAYIEMDESSTVACPGGAVFTATSNFTPAAEIAADPGSVIQCNSEFCRFHKGSELCYRNANHPSCLNFPGYSTGGDSSPHVSWCDACDPQSLVPSFQAQSALLECIVCSEGQFAVGGGILVGGSQLTNNYCVPCPLGGICNAGHIRAASNFWGSPQSDGSFAFFRCPKGVCCPEGGCDVNATCSASSLNRNGSVALCGKCNDGFSVNVGAESCHLTSTCDDASWFFPSCLLTLLFWVGYVLSQPEENNGGIMVIIFYWQMVHHIASDMSPAGAAITTAANFGGGYLPHKKSTAGAGFCPIPGFTPLNKLVFNLLPPSSLLLLVIFVYARASKAAAAAAALVTAPSIFKPRDHHSLRRMALTPVEILQDEQVVVAQRNRLLRFARGVAAAFLTATSSLLTALCGLVDCVPVGQSMVLFKAGGVQCYQPFQYAVFGSIFGLVAAACMLWRHVKVHHRSVFAMGAMQVLASPFEDSHRYWAMVLLMQRSVLVVMDSLITEPLIRAGCMLSWTIGMLLTHTLTKPFNSKITHVLQTVLLSSLALMTFLITPRSVVEQSAVQAPDGLFLYLGRFSSIETLLVLIPFPYFVWHVWDKRELARQKASVFLRYFSDCNDRCPRAQRSYDRERSSLEAPLLLEMSVAGHHRMHTTDLDFDDDKGFTRSHADN